MIPDLAEYMDALLGRAADISTRRMADPRYAAMAKSMALGPALPSQVNGGFDESGDWYEFFRYNYSGLDGPEPLGP
jgi:hypothetical protein